MLIILADDLGYGDVGAFGGQVIATPRIDDLCASGMRLDSFYAHPTCSPSRAALLTGRYAQRVGLPKPIGAWAPRGMDTAEVTLAEVLKTVGYRTATFGKWHIGDAPEQQPTSQGFDEFRGILWGPTGIPLVLRDSVQDTLEYEPDQRYDAFDVTTRTLDFIERSAATGEPFFCLASYAAPHEPAAASPAFQGISADGRDYGDAVEELDASVGVLVDRLSALALRENTLVVFLSDNGATFNRNPYQDGSNAPFSEGKGTTWEGGVRVPACASWPGRVPAGAVQAAPLFIADLFPTVAALAGATLDPTITLDGHDVGAVLEGQPEDPSRVVHLSDKSGFQAVRRGRYKYRLGALYDLVIDPEELVDLSNAFPGETAALAQELNAIQVSVENDHRPPAVSSRLTAKFRADAGLVSPPSNGTNWYSESLDDLTFQAVDVDPFQDLLVVDSAGHGTSSTPGKALRIVDFSGDLRFVGQVPQFATSASSAPMPFTVAMWYRLVDTPLEENIVLLDVGDGEAGLSFTMGDAGEIGDDLAPGNRDDLLVRIGGTLSANSSAVAIDLPQVQPLEFLHLAAVYYGSGDLIVYINGFEAARVFAPGVDCGLNRTWSLFAPDGAVGGSGGPGVVPLFATQSKGDIAALNIVDRALRLNEIQAEYSRYVSMIYCHSQVNTSGERAWLSLGGSFRRADNQMHLQAENLPLGSVGFLLSSLEQGRHPISQGSLCLQGSILRFSKQVYATDAAGQAHGVVDLQLAPPQVVDLTTPIWNFQYWYRDGAGSNFTNGLQITFGN
ncbi:sulfatase-like hydrolase/transferase [Saltatorellus ferox]|uniref:sulfatase-like hydrolase/transferase n=1 Tax=Saltatorellus ferox TaxID=2528018 RepID=UPI003AF3C4F1